jgi:hypothetical protein
MAKTNWLGVVAQKFTKDPISEIFEFEANSIYHACDVLEELSGIKIDGVKNYADLVNLSE